MDEILRNLAPVICALLAAATAWACTRFGPGWKARLHEGTAAADSLPHKVGPTRATLVLDDELVGKAQAYTGIEEKSALVGEALKALIEREAARRLVLLGGTEPDLVAPRRRR